MRNGLIWEGFSILALIGVASVTLGVWLDSLPSVTDEVVGALVVGGSITVAIGAFLVVFPLLFCIFGGVLLGLFSDHL